MRNRIIIFFIALFFLAFAQVKAQNDSNEDVHEITLYAMPTLYPLDWSSPSSLFQSMKDCFMKTRKVKDNYLLGHLAVRIKSPLLNSPMLFAMSSANKWERINLVLKEKIGFGIMGYPLKGRIEPFDELSEKLKIYSERKKLAFITYRINKEAAKRMIAFVNGFTELKKDNKSSSNFYGGSFWPRYENEGSGCSAMGLALMDVADLLPSESDEWLVRVNIPMSIIGGEVNKNKKIKNSLIKKTTNWHDGLGTPNEDFVQYQIYEPSLMFDWILKQRNTPGSNYTLTEQMGAPGIYVDLSDKSVDTIAPVFKKREKEDLFINYYFKKRGLNQLVSN